MSEREADAIQNDAALDLGVGYYGYLRHRLLLIQITKYD